MAQDLVDELNLDALEKMLSDSGENIFPGKKSWILDCPKCGKKKKLYIRRHDGRFVCWFCREVDGFEGRPEFALRELLPGLSMEEIKFRLYGTGIGDGGTFLEIDLKDFWDEEDGEVPTDRLLIPTAFPLNFYDLDRRTSQKGVAYLEGRGISKALAQEYGIRYDPTTFRVIFPIIQRGVLYGWQARSILPGVEPKILTSTDAPRDRTLMFHDRLQGSAHAVLTEGPVDGVKCHLIGGNVVAMGKAVSHAQMRLIVASGVRTLYLGLDPDAAEETARLVRDAGSDIKDIRLLEPAPGCKDLGEMACEAVLEQAHRAQRVSAGHLFIAFN